MKLEVLESVVTVLSGVTYTQVVETPFNKKKQSNF